VFVGPQPEVISLMANKQRARQAAEKVGVPVVPGGAVAGSIADLAKAVAQLGYPIMLKAVAGGSGRGMRIVESGDELEERLAEAKKEALAAFGDDEMLYEKCVIRPRHVEVQVFGDTFGNVVHLGERDCSLQRRHQKVVEEAPAPGLAKGLREKLCECATDLARNVNYRGAGTVEFLVEGGAKKDDSFYFLEMNTRIQVEHPVTEMVYRVDLVTEQFRVAAGKPLSFKQSALKPLGHAIEYRVYAEDPSRGFLPCSGRIEYLARAGGPGVREDSWVEAGTRVSAFYDSLLSKLIVWGRTREEALAASRTLLQEYHLEGIVSTLGFHRWVLQSESFKQGAVDVKWLEREYRGEMLPAGTVGPLILPEPRNQCAKPNA
jgi:acetyl-CoA carboxylase biotin carboxylase subunit